MRKALWLSFFCLWPVAALAGENSSVYTRFDLDETCTPVERGDDFVFGGTWRCKGFQGYDIAVSLSDERIRLGFGPHAPGTCAFLRTFHAFNEALSPVEWRLKDGKAFATIQRWRVAKGEEGKSVTWLVVTKLDGRQACQVHYVAGSYPEANAQARRAADALVSGFDCEHDVPTVDSKVGPPGMDMLSCRELRGE